jgi:molybdopterin-containing oxidoreductase family iron-sulfur binding subunit
MAKSPAPPLDLAEIRARLTQGAAPTFWKGLEEIAETDDFKAFLHREFPGLSEVAGAGLSRRAFMQLMGASIALAGASACNRPAQEKILPYVRAPEEVIPGKPLFFATAVTQGGFANGVLVESNMGRPIKVEGNPEHPASLGATDVFGQAAVLQLWDPARSQAVSHRGHISTWEAFLAVTTDKLNVFSATEGAGLRVLTQTVTSPTLASQIQALVARYPRAQWHQYEPVPRDYVYAGARLAFGEPLESRYYFDKAKVILSLDADFLSAMPGNLRHARDFAAGREIEAGDPRMNRLYAIESTPTITGAMADHRWTFKTSEIEHVALALAARLGVETPALDQFRSPLDERAAKALTDDLKRHRGRALVIAGDHHPPVVHALAHAMNERLGNAGKTITYTKPVVNQPVDQIESLKTLVEDMNAGRVGTLMVIGGNPVYDAPADIDFAKALRAVDFSAHLSLYDDETSEHTRWHIPATHTFEDWSDARAFDGAVTIQQPLIKPLYQNISAHQVLGALLGQPTATSYELVRQYWRSRHRGPDFESFWRESLRVGLIRETRLLERVVAVRQDLGARLSPALASSKQSGIEITFRPDPTIWDGSYTGNAWLQETPKHLTKLTWDNAALIAPALAERLGLSNEELVELRLRGRALKAAIWIAPGHPDGAVSLSLGYGRTRGAGVGTGTGFNAYTLRTSQAPWSDMGLEIIKTGESYMLAATQTHHSMEGHEPVRETTLDHFTRDANFAQDDPHKNPPFATLYPEYEYNQYRWAMTVNLNTCIGCDACTIACQAENNIPVVGKQQVKMGREMHWLRVDSYHKGGLDDPEIYFQPVPCMHCEHAPCEPVCPVEASIHDEDGLNVQVYNRCVGTRFCSNNCPYKVRRFNFLQYANYESPNQSAVHNPEVTVRARGVMEKCTYCLQRINAAKIEADKQGRRVRDGEVVTACQAVCPTNAIVFGDLNDPTSQVSKTKQHPLNYALLADQGTRPRTTYLAKLRNPNPALKDA